MVLESLIGVKYAEKRPVQVFLLGFLYATVAVFLGLWIFRSESSMILVFLTVMASIPLVYATLKFEAERDIKEKKEMSILKGHYLGIRVFIFLFLGYVAAFVVWYLTLPADLVLDLFSTQISTIQAINGNLTSGNATSWTFLSAIIGNNLKVLFFCVFFSFFYGAGAIFILTWNASVISAAIGSFIRDRIGVYASAVGLAKVAGYMHVLSFGLMRYMTHGIFEIIAYFIGGMAGGLISLGVLNYKLGNDNFKIIMRDAVNLVIIAMLVIIFAGLVEVYVTPLMFS